jgi:6-phosphogluconolactonase (cycloisomerase 2 family)
MAEGGFMRERRPLRGSLLCLALVSTLPAACGDGPQAAGSQAGGGFLYVLHRGSSTEPGRLSSYGIDRATGGLNAISGSPYALGHGVTALTVDPSGRFVYACSMEGKLWAFRSEAGSLTPLPGSPFSAGADLESVVVTPSGRFLYVADAAAEVIRGFLIDPASGVPARLPGSAFRAANNVAHLGIDAAERFLYATASDERGLLLGYVLDAANGSLTGFKGPEIPGQWFPSLSLPPGGRFLYAWSSDRPNVAGYAIDGLSGQLASLQGSPFAVSPLLQLAWAPAGRLALGLHSDSLSTSTVDPATGALQWLGASVPTPGSSSEAVALDPLGRFAYVADSAANTIAIFSLDSSSGRLTFERSAPTSPRPFVLAVSGAPAP